MRSWCSIDRRQAFDEGKESNNNNNNDNNIVFPFDSTVLKAANSVLMTLMLLFPFLCCFRYDLLLLWSTVCDLSFEQLNISWYRVFLKKVLHKRDEKMQEKMKMT